MANIRNIRAALPLIARALGDKLGVEVKQGPEARTDGNIIYIPPLSDDDKVLKGKQYSAYELAKILGIGMIVHESTHVRYTDFKAVDFKTITPLFETLLCFLEDIRCEYRISRDFPGTADDLSQMVNVLSKDGFWLAPTNDTHPASIMSSYILYKLRHDYLGQKGIGEILAETEKVFNSTYSEGIGIKLNALMFDIELCRSTKDCADLASKIIQMMEEEAKKEEEEQQQQDGGDSQDQSQSQQGDDQSSQGESQGEGGQDQQSGNGEAGDTGETQDSQNDKQGSAGAGDGAQKEGALSKALKSGAGDQAEDLGEKLSGILNSMVSPETSSRMANTITTKAAGVDTEFIGEIQASVNALKHKLQILLQSSARTKILSAPMGNKIRASKLHTAKLGGNIFQKKVRTVQVNTAVKILMDVSTSMAGVEIEIAKRAGFALAMALESIPGVAVSTSVFPDSDGNWLAVKNLNSFHEPVRSRSLNYKNQSAGGGTPLSESLMAVAYDLVKQKEPRKILFVMTDGDPNDLKAAANSIRMIEQSGIEVCGLGIAHDVSHLFARNAKIDDINELSQAMFTMMQNVLLKAA